MKKRSFKVSKGRASRYLARRKISKKSPKGVSKYRSMIGARGRGRKFGPNHPLVRAAILRRY